MIVRRIEGATRVLNAPQDWDETRDGPCAGLPVRDITVTMEGGLVEDLIGHSKATGVPFMVSAWEPTPDELAKLNAGAPVYLWVNGTTHPVVAMSVGEEPE